MQIAEIAKTEHISLVFGKHFYYGCVIQVLGAKRKSDPIMAQSLNRKYSDYYLIAKPASHNFYEPCDGWTKPLCRPKTDDGSA